MANSLRLRGRMMLLLTFFLEICIMYAKKAFLHQDSTSLQCPTLQVSSNVIFPISNIRTRSHLHRAHNLINFITITITITLTNFDDTDVQR